MKWITSIILSLLLIFGTSAQAQKIEVLRTFKLNQPHSLRGIFAQNPTTIWVTGSKSAVYRTQNKGKSWQRIIIPNTKAYDFRDIHVFNDGTIIIMSAGSAEKSKIFRSEDNGETWEVVYTMNHATGFLNSIAFWDEKNGLAFGDPIDGAIFILKTEDAGMTWQPISPKNIPQIEKNEAGFAASGSCISTSGNKDAWIVTGGAISRVYKTKDLGKSWRVYPTPMLSGKTSTGSFAVHFFNAQNGIIVGGDYTKTADTTQTMAITQNGGKSWQPIPQLPFQSAISHISNPKGNIYISTGPDGNYFSNNLKKWKKFGQQGFHCLTTQQNDIWLAGSNGRIALAEVK